MWTANTRESSWEIGKPSTMTRQLGQEWAVSQRPKTGAVHLRTLDRKEQDSAADSSWEHHTRNSTQRRAEATCVKLTFIASTQPKPTQNLTFARIMEFNAKSTTFKLTSAMSGEGRMWVGILISRSWWNDLNFIAMSVIQMSGVNICESTMPKIWMPKNYFLPPFKDHQEIKLWDVRNVWIQVTCRPRKKLAPWANSFTQKLIPLHTQNQASLLIPACAVLRFPRQKAWPVFQVGNCTAHSMTSLG